MLRNINKVNVKAINKPTFIQARSVGHLNKFPAIYNEHYLHYAPGTPERLSLEQQLKRVRSEVVEVPVVVDGKEIYTGNTVDYVIPCDHQKVIAKIHQAGDREVQLAVDSALKARYEWNNTPITVRGQVFRRAADLISTRYRSYMNAVTMLGVGKTAWQAEIDAAAEQIDFLRMNCNFADEMMANQPLQSVGNWNRVKYHGLEGFVATISPFNFIAIGTNLNSAPALMGNTTVWKPSHSAALPNYVAFNILREAGLPDGVINFVPCAPETMEKAIKHREMAGLHFTGSTGVFSHLIKTIGTNISDYKSYPRVVGETGGKNAHLVHPSADRETVLNCTVASFTEYSGQKCSAASRLFIPASWWNNGFKEELVAKTEALKVGQVDDFTNFTSSVIDANSFNRLSSVIDSVKTHDNAKIVAGGTYDNSVGYFVRPTIIECESHDVYMQKEFFGPILAVKVYDDSKPGFWEQATKEVDNVAYGLTCAVFSHDVKATQYAESHLTHAAGNLYFNCPSTGAIVGQQPFGGSRASGTNSKAGSSNNLLQWSHVQAIKDTSIPRTKLEYPHMG